jgi:hypothetical protein
VNTNAMFYTQNGIAHRTRRAQPNAPTRRGVPETIHIDIGTPTICRKGVMDIATDRSAKPRRLVFFPRIDAGH